MVKEKVRLHPRNKHRFGYDFKELVDSCPDLRTFVIINKYGGESIDFFNPKGVKLLNKALLKYYYNIENWVIPPGYLTPPIPGRADYIHYAADLLASCNNGKIPKGQNIRCLDIGVGANCIYPIIGNSEYGWSFIGSDIDMASIKSASKIVEMNSELAGIVELRNQSAVNDIFNGIIHKDEFIDLAICNPPFHSSSKEAQSAALRKLRNLKQKKVSRPQLNFGGQNSELWCEGGEKRFVKTMISQSRQFSESCLWFTTLLSKESNLNSIYKALEKVKPTEIKTISMGQGNKVSRFVAWSFHSVEQQRNWVKTRWK